MKYLSLIFLFLLLFNCSKPKTVLICGDHICINKAEAEQYFEENLTLEVKVVNKKINNDIDLIELNLEENPTGKKKITLLSKKNTSKDLKILTNEEKSKIKKNINKKRKKKKINKKYIDKKKKDINAKIKKKVDDSKKLKNQ